MATSYVNFNTLVGKESYSERAYFNSEIFRMLFGGSPSDWGAKLSLRQGPNWDRMQKISKDFGLSFDYVAGINLSDECINFQSGASLQKHLQNYGCTSVAVDHVIGQTLDLFTVELCIVREGEAIYVTMPPYLCLLGMGKHLAMCTNHLFDSVDFSGVPISHIRRSLLDMTSIEEAVTFLQGLKPTTSVNFMISDGTKSVDIEVTRNGVKVIQPKGMDGQVIAHTNHILTKPFDEDSSCLRLRTASDVLCLESLMGCAGSPLTPESRVEMALTKQNVVQPIDLSAAFGTIITVWLDPKTKTLAYQDPGQTGFTKIQLKD